MDYRMTVMEVFNFVHFFLFDIRVFRKRLLWWKKYIWPKLTYWQSTTYLFRDDLAYANINLWFITFLDTFFLQMNSLPFILYLLICSFVMFKVYKIGFFIVQWAHYIPLHIILIFFLLSIDFKWSTRLTFYLNFACQYEIEK